MSASQFKHPTLSEYINRGHEWYQAWTRVNGAASLQPWSEIEKELRREHATVSKMDTTQQGIYWFEKAQRNALVLSATKERLDRALAAQRSRELVGDSLRDVKEQEAHARRKA